MSDKKNEKESLIPTQKTSRDWKDFVPTLLRVTKPKEPRRFYYEEEQLEYKKVQDLQRLGIKF